MKWKVLAVICFVMIIPLLGVWLHDSNDYGSKLFFSKEKKEIVIKVKDDLFGGEVSKTEWQEGFWLGLLPPTDKLSIRIMLGVVPLGSMLLGLGAICLFMNFRQKVFKNNIKEKSMKSTTKIGLIALLLMAFLVNNSYSTDLKLGVSGKKQFKANKSVGPLELKFVSTAPLEEIRGAVSDNLIQSTVYLDPSNLEGISGKVSYQTKNLETGLKTRDEHLRSDEWLDADKYPEISFEVKGMKDIKIISSDGGKGTIEATVMGTYSMHGKTKSIVVPIKLIYIKESESSKKRASGDFLSVEGKFQIALKDFEVGGKKMSTIGSKVGEKIDINFRLFYNVQ
jgi:polyisoprenoid-binding protein YceI